MCAGCIEGGRCLNKTTTNLSVELIEVVILFLTRFSTGALYRKVLLLGYRRSIQNGIIIKMMLSSPHERAWEQHVLHDSFIERAVSNFLFDLDNRHFYPRELLLSIDILCQLVIAIVHLVDLICYILILEVELLHWINKASQFNGKLFLSLGYLVELSNRTSIVLINANFVLADKCKVLF